MLPLELIQNKTLEIETNFDHCLTEDFFRYLKTAITEEKPTVLLVKINYDLIHVLDRSKLKKVLLTNLRTDLDKTTNMSDVGDIKFKNDIFVEEAQSINKQVDNDVNYIRLVECKLTKNLTKEEVEIQATNVIKIIYNESSNVINYQ